MSDSSQLDAGGRRPRAAHRRFTITIGSLLSAVLLVVLAACGGGGGSSDAAKKDTFTFAAPFGTPTYDPIKISNPFQNTFLYPVYDRLVHLAPDGELIPGLAESWEFNTDATQLTFKLRTGVLFSDGEKLTAEVVKANIERSKNTPASAVASYLKGIESIETPDETTVVLALASPDVSLPGAFAERAGMMISPKALTGTTLDTQPVGAGEYTLVSYVDNDRAVYEQRSDYWSTENPGSKNLQIRIFTDIQARNNALLTGEADAGWTDAQGVATFESDGDFDVITDPVLAYSRITFSNQAFADQRVRKAISLAVDREAFNQLVFEGNAEIIGQPWPSSYYAAAPDVDLKQDIPEAKRLLKEAGQENLTFTVVIPALDPHPPYVEAMQAMLKEAGVTMEIVQVEPAQIADIYHIQGKYDALIAYFPGTPDPLITVAQTVMPTGFFNQGKFVDQPVIDLYEEAVAETDETRRTEILQDLSAVLAEEVVDIPFFSQVRPTAVNNRVEGWEHYISGVPEFRGVSVTK